MLTPSWAHGSARARRRNALTCYGRRAAAGARRIGRDCPRSTVADEEPGQRLGRSRSVWKTGSGCASHPDVRLESNGLQETKQPIDGHLLQAARQNPGHLDRGASADHHLRPRVSRSSVANSWNRRTGSAALSTDTALVKRMRCVRTAAATRMTTGAESRNSRRSRTNRGPLVRALDLRDQALRRSEALTARRSSVNAAAKLSMPISTLT